MLGFNFGGLGFSLSGLGPKLLKLCRLGPAPTRKRLAGTATEVNEP